MKREEYEALCERAPEPNTMFDLAGMLSNQESRTLVYGYTTVKKTFHLYLMYGTIHRAIYSDGWDNRPPTNVEHEVYPNGIDLWDTIPNKRVFPCASDFEFCALLKRLGVEVPFTTFNENRPEQTFHGHVFEAPEAHSKP